MATFVDFPLSEKIKKNLEALGFTQPTEIQAKVIPQLLKNPQTDVHAQAQTGTGKTLAFGIPLLHAIDPQMKSVQALIVAPTRELVLQIYESLRDVARDSGIHIEPIYGGMPINRQIDNIRRGAQIIVGTPGRLNDHLRRKTLTLKTLKILVLDEADIMLEMGFKEEIDSILEYAPKTRAIWLFSATVLPGIKQLIQSHMHDVLSVKAAGKSVLSPQVKQYYCVVPARKKIDALARFIEAAPEFYGIVFCQTKILTTEVMEALVSKGFKANCLHGDMKQALRNQVIKGFKNKDFTILIATDVAARGIDVSNLTHVINFSLPKEHESYVHRIGRTGRAGKEGIAIVFIAPSELHQLRRLEKATQIPLQEIPIPPIESIIAIKMGAVSDFIEQAKQSPEKLSPVGKALQELINSFSEDEIRNSLVKALEYKFFRDMTHEDIKIDSQTSGPLEICMEVGQEDGITESAVRNHLYTVCKLLPQEANKVRVLRTRTFISIPGNKLQGCMAALQDKPLIQKKYATYLVEEPRRDRRPAGRRPDRFRSTTRRR